MSSTETMEEVKERIKRETGFTVNIKDINAAIHKRLRKSDPINMAYDDVVAKLAEHLPLFATALEASLAQRADAEASQTAAVSFNRLKPANEVMQDQGLSLDEVLAHGGVYTGDMYTLVDPELVKLNLAAAAQATATESAPQVSFVDSAARRAMLTSRRPRASEAEWAVVDKLTDTFLNFIRVQASGVFRPPVIRVTCQAIGAPPDAETVVLTISLQENGGYTSLPEGFEPVGGKPYAYDSPLRAGWVVELERMEFLGLRLRPQDSFMLFTENHKRLMQQELGGLPWVSHICNACLQQLDPLLVGKIMLLLEGKHSLPGRLEKTQAVLKELGYVEQAESLTVLRFKGMHFECGPVLDAMAPIADEMGEADFSDPHVVQEFMVRVNRALVDVLQKLKQNPRNSHMTYRLLRDRAADIVDNLMGDSDDQ